jgi:hypothetical protein
MLLFANSHEPADLHPLPLELPRRRGTGAGAGAGAGAPDAQAQAQAQDQALSGLGLESPAAGGAGGRGCCGRVSRVCGDIGPGLRLIYGDSLLRKVISTNALNAYTNGSLLLLIVMCGRLSVAEGGLGFSPKEMGYVFGWFGFCSIVFQFSCYKRLHARLGLQKIFMAGAGSLGTATFLYPLAGYVPHHVLSMDDASARVLTRVLVALVLVGVAVGFMLCLPVVSTMVSLAAPAGRQGLTQGTAQSLASLFRSFGPVSVGAGFTVTVGMGYPVIMFAFLASLNLLCFFVIRSLSAEQGALFKHAKPGHSHGARDEEASPSSKASRGEATSLSSPRASLVPLRRAAGHGGNSPGLLGDSGGDLASLQRRGSAARSNSGVDLALRLSGINERQWDEQDERGSASRLQEAQAVNNLSLSLSLEDEADGEGERRGSDADHARFLTSSVHFDDRSDSD